MVELSSNKYSIDDANAAVTAVYGAIAGALSKYNINASNYSIGALAVTESVEVYNAYQSGSMKDVEIEAGGWIGSLGVSSEEVVHP